MRVLVVSDTAFLPPTAGNRQRLNQMLDYLVAQGIEVGMLMLPRVDRAEWDVEGMQARLAWFEVARPPGARRLLERLAGAAARWRPGGPGTPRPLGIDDWCPPWFRSRTEEVVGVWGPDVVIVEYVFLSACIEPRGRRRGSAPLRVIDTLDLMHRRRAVYDAVGMPPQWFHTTRDEERRGLARADLVLAIAEDEARVLREMVPGTPVLTVPPGCPASPAPPAAAHPARILFVASYNDVNVRGLEWFLAAVWPALRAVVPGVELHVCGSIAAKLPPPPAGVVVRGVLASLAAEYAEARVVIDPVSAGTGTPLKVAEALCHGRPVVTARAGLFGADPREVAGGVVVAEDAAAFAGAVRRLLDDGPAWHRLAAAAADHGARHLSPRAVFAPLVAELAARTR
jgi:glycosyltransferase involved in cell wall biosynthesis